MSEKYALMKYMKELNRKMTDKEIEATDLKASIIKKDNAILTLDIENKSIKDCVKWQQNNATELTGQLAVIKNDKVDLDKIVNANNLKISLLNDSVATVKSENAVHVKLIEELKHKLTITNKEITELNATLEEKDAIIQEIQAQATSLKETIESYYLEI